MIYASCGCGSAGGGGIADRVRECALGVVKISAMEMEGRKEEWAGGRAGDGKQAGGFRFSSSSLSVFSFTAGQGQRAGRQLSCPR